MQNILIQPDTYISILEQEYHGPNLVLSQLSISDSGVYQCIARNGVQPSARKRLMLYIDCEQQLYQIIFIYIYV